MRSPLAMIVAVLALAAVAGCGGGDADSSTDVDQLLEETFSGDKQIDSGRLQLDVGIEAEGEEPVRLGLSGPFQSEGEGRLPRFDLDASFEGAGQALEAGVTSTGDRGFVSFQGTDYEVSRPVFDQFKAGFEQAQQEGSEQEGQSLATLGIDPRRWLTDARNAGEADVGGTETIRITGGVDVPKLLDDINQALERAGSLGLQGSEDLPEQLTEEQQRQAAEAIRDLSVEIYTGAEDKILRRMVIALAIEDPEGAGTADVRIDLSLLELNEDQEIEAPADPRPFDELLGGLGDLGLGDLGGGGAAPEGGGGADQESLEAYAECIQQAGDDNEAARECAELLTP